MAIGIEVIDNLSCPVIRCDVCGHRIETVDDGGYCWKMGTDEPAPIAFFHKGQCAIQHMHGKSMIGDQGLDVFVPFLMANLKMNWGRLKKAKQTAAMMSRF